MDPTQGEEPIFRPADFESKWQNYWREHDVFACDTAKSSNKSYILTMFPYPSSDYLHVGHGRPYILGDSVARFLKMKGRRVLAPMGFDAFGLPAENFAIRSGVHPKKSTYENIAKMKEQFRPWGILYDWDREIKTCDETYYKWTQWLFLQFFKKGLAYRAKAPVNFCPHCQTTLANEQVVEGHCERCETAVEQKLLTQWFLKITEYADRLLNDLDQLPRWPDRVKQMQRNWIGRSEGAEVAFSIQDSDEKITVFTTRPDTLFGATYLVLAPEHPMVAGLVEGSPEKKAVLDHVRWASQQSKIQRSSEEKSKEGVSTGKYAINPVNNEALPIYIASYVLMDYGSGAIMAVPAHDQRDFEFAKQHNLPLRPVIQPKEKPLVASEMAQAFTGEGLLSASGRFDGLEASEGALQITAWLEEQKKGRKAISYRLRDWLISRQRYWGAPIPIIHCPNCGEVAVPDDQLPVRLPDNVDFSPQGESPLARSSQFVETKCPRCGQPAKRETDTMDTFVDSSWYFFRYLDPHNLEEPWKKQIAKDWLPIDLYVGGVEHAILHLMYARFFTKVLFDLGLSSSEEPFKRLFTQGMILKDGEKMSKSKGNVVHPDALIAKFGADTQRVYTLFMGPPEKDAEWDDRAVEGAHRFLGRVYRLVMKHLEFLRAGNVIRPGAIHTDSDEGRNLRRQVHQTALKVTQELEDHLHLNTALASIMELSHPLQKYLDASPEEAVACEAVHYLVLLISPFAPHLAEELWSNLGGKTSVLEVAWPDVDTQALATDKITVVVQVSGKLRAKLSVAPGAGKDEVTQLAVKDQSVMPHIEGKKIIKTIYVPNKLLNLVVK